MPDAIASVRRFNRVVTQKAGALEAGFLGLGRPLGAARVLWEIGPAGCEVRALRRRLGLDSGYLSRLLRGLEAEQLVAVAPDPADRRRRIATLTAAGRRGARRARRTQRRGRPRDGRHARARPAGAPRRGDARGRAAPRRGRGRPASRRSGPPGRAALHRRILRGARRALRRRLRPGDQPPRAPRPAPPRLPGRGGGGLRRRHASRRLERGQARVGRGRRPRARARAAADVGAGGGRDPQRQRGGPARHEPPPRRGAGAVPVARLSRDPRVQRRGLRRPLVREAPAAARVARCRGGCASAGRRSTPG